MYNYESLPDDTFWITTAAHQCFDQSEVEKTRVLFFFDSDDRKGVVEARGVDVVGVNVAQDEILLSCRVSSLEEGRNVRRRFVKNQARGDPPEGFDFSFMVHHPHGTSKRVSFGRVKDAVADSGGFVADEHLSIINFLLSNITERENISDKDLLYFFLSVLLIPPSIVLCKFIADRIPSIQDPQKALLDLAIQRGLVTQPTKEIMNKLKEGISTWRDDVMSKLIRKIPNLTMLPTEEHDAAIARNLPSIHAEEAREMDPAWRQRLGETERAVWNMANEMCGLGMMNHSNFFSRVYYNMATCAGSSGAAFFRWHQPKAGQWRIYHGTHVAGCGHKGNRSGCATLRVMEVDPCSGNTVSKSRLILTMILIVMLQIIATCWLVKYLLF